MTTSHRVTQRIANAIFKTAGFFVIVFALIVTVNAKLDQLRTQSDIDPGMSVAEYSRQLDCLTRNIYWEAGSEPFEGKVAVAQVTLNRVESGRFANTVCGVVYQKTMFYEKVVCQFSWYCEAGNRTRPIHSRAWRESEEVAKKVLLEGFRLPSVETALYYHADYVNPQWGKPRVAKIGRHIFYSESKI